MKVLLDHVSFKALPGDMIALITLSLRVHDLTGSAYAVSALFGATMLPIVAFAPLGGRLTDRVESTRVLLGASVAQAVVAAGVPGLVVGLVLLDRLDTRTLTIGASVVAVAGAMALTLGTRRTAAAPAALGGTRVALAGAAGNLVPAVAYAAVGSTATSSTNGLIVVLAVLALAAFVWAVLRRVG